MNRSPLFYPLNRGGEAEAGGAADLQTDVMRFMAILSLCLVAIFALVQSIPIAPRSEEAQTIKVTENTPRTESELVLEPDVNPEPIVKTEAEIKLTRPTPAKRVVQEEKVVLQRPNPAAVKKDIPIPDKVTPEATVAAAQPVVEGFTLQFETDAALTRLVARQIVGLYAMTANTSLRMNIDGDEVSFWPASLPGRFHEMDSSTVPASVVAAYRNGNSKADVEWGVTLPADMSRELDGFLSNASGGSLVISGNGQINLRR